MGIEVAMTPVAPDGNGMVQERDGALAPTKVALESIRLSPRSRPRSGMMSQSLIAALSSSPPGSI